jgi:hypothetical protein
MPIKRVGFNTFSSKSISTDITKEGVLYSGYPTAYYSDNFDGNGGWIDVNGNWIVANNSKSTTTPSSSYPITLNYDIRAKNITASINVNNAGAGIVFWYVDSNNWLAVFPYYYSEIENYGNGVFACNCQTCYQQCCSGRSDTITRIVCPSSSSAGPGCWSGTQQGSYNTSIGPCGFGGSLGSSGACPSGTTHYQGNGTCWRNVSSASYIQCNPYNCNCQECQAQRNRYYFSLRLIKNSGGIKTTLVTQQIQNNLDDTINLTRIRVNTMGDIVTANSYSSNGTLLSGQISYTASGETKGIGTGLIFAPSARRESSVMSNYSLSAFYS